MLREPQRGYNRGKLGIVRGEKITHGVLGELKRGYYRGKLRIVRVGKEAYGVLGSCKENITGES